MNRKKILIGAGAVVTLLIVYTLYRRHQDAKAAEMDAAAATDPTDPTSLDDLYRQSLASQIAVAPRPVPYEDFPVYPQPQLPTTDPATGTTPSPSDTSNTGDSTPAPAPTGVVAVMTPAPVSITRSPPGGTPGGPVAIAPHYTPPPVMGPPPHMTPAPWISPLRR